MTSTTRRDCANVSETNFQPLLSTAFHVLLNSMLNAYKFTNIIKKVVLGSYGKALVGKSLSCYIVYALY